MARVRVRKRPKGEWAEVTRERQLPSESQVLRSDRRTAREEFRENQTDGAHDAHFVPSTQILKGGPLAHHARIDQERTPLGINADGAFGRDDS